MSHDIWDESHTKTPEITCADCGDKVYVVVEFKRNERRTWLCFDCVRDAAKDIADFIEDHGEPRT